MICTGFAGGNTLSGLQKKTGNTGITGLVLIMVKTVAALYHVRLGIQVLGTKHETEELRRRKETLERPSRVERY